EIRKAAVAELDEALASIQTNGWRVAPQKAARSVRAALNYYVTHGTVNAPKGEPGFVDGERVPLGDWLSRLHDPKRLKMVRSWVDPVMVALGMRLETNQPPANVPMGTAGLRDEYIVRIEEVVVGDPVDGSVAGPGGPGRSTVGDQQRGYGDGDDTATRTLSAPKRQASPLEGSDRRPAAPGDASADVSFPDGGLVGGSVGPAGGFELPEVGGGLLDGFGGPQESEPGLPVLDAGPQTPSGFAWWDTVGQWFDDVNQPRVFGEGVAQPALLDEAGLEPLDDAPAHQLVEPDPSSGNRGGPFIDPAELLGPDTGNPGSFLDFLNHQDDLNDQDDLDRMGVGSWIRGEGGRQDLPLEADSPLREENAPPP
ncbi:hypothetical protein ACFZAR_44845, partial [Streptomyces sp. NPDC008222]|uniref:hypothetical protein n=1 Tax=Streptomyces sp. NPDC008222 TaxID=3364820 RepID=UPI0036EAFE97